MEAFFKKYSVGDEDFNCHEKTKKQWKMCIVKTLKLFYFFYFAQSFIPIFGPQLSHQNFKKLQITDFPEKLSWKSPQISWEKFLAPKNMYLDAKTKSIPLVKLVKFKLKIFHNRVCHLMVTFNISATTGPIEKNFCRLISLPTSIYKMVNWIFSRSWVLKTQIFFEI